MSVDFATIPISTGASMEWPADDDDEVAQHVAPSRRCKPRREAAGEAECEPDDDLTKRFADLELKYAKLESAHEEQRKAAESERASRMAAEARARPKQMAHDGEAGFANCVNQMFLPDGMEPVDIYLSRGGGLDHKSARRGTLRRIALGEVGGITWSALVVFFFPGFFLQPRDSGKEFVKSDLDP